MAKINIFRDYSGTFWIANVMELFERAAYYGLNSILGGYLTLSVAEGGLGFDTQSVGFLQGLVYAFTFILPILGGALADRYGYRRMLTLAFSLLAIGYFAAGNIRRPGPIRTNRRFLFSILVTVEIDRSPCQPQSGRRHP